MGRRSYFVESTPIEGRASDRPLSRGRKTIGDSPMGRAAIGRIAVLHMDTSADGVALDEQVAVDCGRGHATNP